jgi:O-antigen/teichoic acid export membrane protein
MGSRLSWGVADQGVSSLTNFLLNIFIARMLGAEQFGAFSLAYVTYGVADNMSRGLSIEPLLVRFSGTKLSNWRLATSGCTGTALLVGLVTGCFALIAGIVMGGTTGEAFSGLGLMLPGLMLQDSWRYAFFAVAKGHHALINDVIWAVVEIPLLLALKLTGHTNVFWFVIAWGTGACAGGVAGAFQARTVPSLNRALSWLTVHRDLGPRFLVENVGSNAADTLRSYGMSSLLGVESVGYMQAANVLMGPVKILSFGVSMITIPEAATLMHHAREKGVRYCIGVSIGQTALSVVWTVFLLISLPLGLGHLMIGGLWEKAYPLVLPTALTVIASCAGAGARTGLHALGAAKRSLNTALIAAAISLTFSLVGAAFSGLEIALYFVAVAGWIGTVVNWVQLRQELREAGAASGPDLSRAVRPRSRHHKSGHSQLPRVQGAKNTPDAPISGGAVSRTATQRSYVREEQKSMPRAATSGKEMQ